MNRTIIGFLGKLIILVGLSMVVPLLMSVYDNEHIMDVYLTSIAVTLACGGLCLGIGHGAKSLLRIRDGFLLVTLAWLSASFFGTMPMFMSGYFPNYLDAFFETLSGFTATGITVLAEVESLPRSILLWRSMTQWARRHGDRRPLCGDAFWRQRQHPALERRGHRSCERKTQPPQQRFGEDSLDHLSDPDAPEFPRPSLFAAGAF